MQLSVVILAAGQGKRMNSDLPKVLQPLAGKPLLAHVVETAQSLAPEAIYVVYGHGGAQVQAAFEHDPLDWVLQAAQWGTGHALMQAMPMIPDTHRVLVLYGDVPLIRASTLRMLLASAAAEGLALLSAEVAAPGGFGRILRDAAGSVVGIVEERDATPEQRRIREIHSGLLTAPAGPLREWLGALSNDNVQHEYYLTDVVAEAVKAGRRVTAIPAASEPEILGVNDKLQLAHVESCLRAERARELMRAGATLVDPLRIDIRGTVEVGRDVCIDVNTVFTGTVKLGARVKIGPNCLIRESSIGADTEIQANSIVDHAAVGAHCVVGPFARIRPDSVLGPRVHIGNFVEIKNSSLGTGAKANHLTYLGDAEVGAGVNVGAGTVTCNYDGAEKWPTVIEDRAFIGSGSMLVAPVRIGAGATIGAGSTITDNAPADALTLTRARQTTIDGWTRPTKLDAREKAEAIAGILQEPETAAKPDPK
jgi:bifunctional UDP-N-acetylglucosamine pyrophosphorylase/glucosamine-1-phosphate N-acetyltransferase